MSRLKFKILPSVPSWLRVVAVRRSGRLGLASLGPGGAASGGRGQGEHSLPPAELLQPPVIWTSLPVLRITDYMLYREAALGD